MSIKLFSGFVGSFKSYNATRIGCQVADAPLRKSWVVANFPIKPKKTMFSKWRKKKFNQPRWIFKKNDDLTVDFLVKKSLEMGWNKKESSALVIFDEASIPFNSRNWNKPDRMDWIEFLSQSRKFGYDFIFITQDAKMLDKQIRALCEYEVQHKKMNNMFPFMLLTPFKISLGASISFWNGVKGRGALQMFIFNKSIADRYDTLRIFNDQDLPPATDSAALKGAGSAGGSLEPVEAVGVKTDA